ncbi:MAG: 50S ribosomal protein L11 methyltransferase, partial [Lentisphaeria bacterium]|nr:50S ribosomal protein L11 methyltransferase [Lentisphaeria bacterium]
MEDLLYCCSFSDASRDTGITAELLSAMGWDFSSRLDAESGETWQTLYFSEKSEAEEAKAKLEELRPIWNELEIVFGEVSVTELKKENWAESWKIHFKPMEISDRLAITPPWVDFPAKENQKVIILNPGLSFGTGQHATTTFCMTKLDELAQTLPENSSMLDAGCGSGILAIAAVKLGWKDVYAFDIDPDAVRISQE